ncbi:hypothetical protein DQ354_18800 [Arthrobacter sp. AQ5-06]|nr:hypothetical protein DQ354_18800 [Arthrobacter sp. AQ5-06]
MGLLFVPGALVAWASRVRGMALVAIAPAITVSIVAVSALLAPLANMKWSLLPVLLLTAVIAAIALVITSRFGGTFQAPRYRFHSINWWVGVGHALALLAAAFLIGRRLVAAFGRPEGFSQTFDNVFHLNAVRYILDTGSGSSITVSSMTGGGFYPAAWHDLVALVASITGSEIPVSVNVVNIVVGAFVWPLGCIFLAHTTLGNRVVVSVAAGILSAGFGAFPLLLLDFGVLYPNFLGNALLPVAVGLAIQAMGLASSAVESKPVRWLLFLSVLPGISLAHPSSTMALVAMLLAPLLILWIRLTTTVARRSSRPSLVVPGMILPLLIGLGTVAVLWKTIRPPEIAAFWPPIETTGRAIGEVIASSAIGRPVSWVVMVLAVAGLMSLILRRSHLWLVGMYVVISGLFVVVASFPFGEVRTFFTGVWYNDPPRLASLLPVVVLPLAVIGAVRGWDRFVVPMFASFPITNNSSVEEKPCDTPRYVAVLAGLAVSGLLVAGTQQANVREAAISASGGYQLTNESPLVSADEMALLMRMNNELPEDAVIVGNPWNGSALAYAFTGRDVIQFHILSELRAGSEKLYTGLNAAATDPSVCPIVERLKLSYVLDFGHREVHGGDNGFRGLDNLEEAGVATLVDSEGQAKIYKLTACGQ